MVHEPVKAATGDGEGMRRLFNQDCMEAMKDMPDKAYDLAIVENNACFSRLHTL